MYPLPKDMEYKTRAEARADYEKRYGCSACGGFVTMYYIHDELWKQVFPQTNQYWSPEWRGEKMDLLGLLCLVCVEKRLGRKLVIEDFKDHQTNTGILFGFNLKKNLDNNEQLWYNTL